jgi:hypothetical protein
MGDRCYWTAVVHPKHVKQFVRITGVDPGSFFLRTPADWAEFSDDQMDYGGMDLMAKAAEKKLKFYGHHFGGDEYPARLFVSPGEGKLYALPMEDRGQDKPVPYIPLCDHGWFDPLLLAEYQEIMSIYNEFQAAAGRG